ncbi:HdeD family acid-resistance protein [Microbacterium sp. GXF6406]
MSDTAPTATPLFRSARIALAVFGVLALIAGIAILVWPLKSAFLVTGIIAAFFILAGVTYIGLGIFSKAKGWWAGVGHIVLGLLYIVAGAFAFVNPVDAALGLAIFTAVFIGVSWIVDGIVSLTLLHKDGSKVWTILYALLSIIAGVIVLFSPMLAAVALWWVLGISLVVLGIIQIIRAITLGKDEPTIAAETAPDAVFAPSAAPPANG